MSILAFAITAMTLSLVHPLGPPKNMVAVATHDIPAGTVLSASDIKLASVFRDDLPADSIEQTTSILHRALVAPMFTGDVIRQRDILDAQLIHQIGAGAVAVPVHVSTSAAALVRRGDRVDVLSGNPDGPASGIRFGSTVATDVLVVISSLTTTNSSVIGGASNSSGSDVVVIARPAQAAAIAAASVQSTLTLALRGADN